MKSKPKLMIVLGCGGHTSQMIMVTELLYDSYDFEYVVNDDDNKSIKKIKFPGDVHVIPRPRRVYDKSVIRSVFLTIRSILKSFRIIMCSKSRGIVSAGSGLAVPLFYGQSFLERRESLLSPGPE